MAYFLKQPYSVWEKCDFISEHNHKNHLEIVFDKDNIIALLPHEKFVDGEVTDNSEQYNSEKLAKAKQKKLAENSEKLNLKRYGQSFSVILQEKECVFDTTEQTQSDLQTAAIVTSSGGTYDNWVTNNGVVINLTAEDLQKIFICFFQLVSPLYQLDLQYKNEIENATSAEDVENIEIEY